MPVVRMQRPPAIPINVSLMLALTVLSSCAGASHVEPIAPPTARTALDEGAESRAVRAARAAQNRAIALLDTASIATHWTEDVEIRRGLGILVTGRSAYQRLFNPDASAVARGSELIYQREPTRVIVSDVWPLAYEEGMWAGHLGRADGPVQIGGRYAAQWVKRGGRWLIRGEVFVALTCADAGCASKAAP